MNFMNYSENDFNSGKIFIEIQLIGYHLPYLDSSFTNALKCCIQSHLYGSLALLFSISKFSIKLTCTIQSTI